MPYVPFEMQRRFHEDPSPFKAIVGGPASGRTTAACAETCMLTGVGLVVAPTFRMLQQLRCEIEIAARAGCVNNTTHYASGDNPEMIRGLRPDWIVVDGFDHLSSEARASIVSRRAPKIVVTMDGAHPYSELMGFTCFEFWTYDNPHLSPGHLERMIESYGSSSRYLIPGLPNQSRGKFFLIG